MNWDDLKVYLAILRSGSVRSAANAMGVSHSTVLRRLDSLEESIGVSLFHRLPSGYELTEDGELLRERAEDIEMSAIAFQRGATGVGQERVGTITVTMPEPFATHYFSDHMGEFQKRHPGIDLDVVFTYDVLDLSRRAADVAVRFMMSPDDRLVGRRLPHFAEGFYATPDYLKRFDLDDPEGGASWIGWRQDQSWIDAGPFPQLPMRWKMPSISVQTAACRKGFGLAQLPCFIGDRDQELIRIPGTDITQGYDGWVLYHEDLRGTARIKSFTDFLVEILSDDQELLEGRLPRFVDA